MPSWSSLHVARVGSADWPIRLERMLIMGIAEQIRQNQDVKEMTRRAIMILAAAGEDVSDLRSEFIKVYGEEV